MDYEQTLDEIVRRSGLRTRTDADRVVRATLRTLACCAPGDLVAALAAELPPVLAEPLSDAPRRTGVDLCGFIQRVSQLSELEIPQSTYAARVVFELVHESAGPGALAAVRLSLGHDLRVLFDAGARGAGR